MQKWEYMQMKQTWDPGNLAYYWNDDKERLEKSTPVQRLDDFGEDGWELAAAYLDEENQEITYLLKRPIV